MDLTSKQKKAQKIINLLVKTCWEDAQFKQQLINAPIKTIEKVTGKPSRFPKGLSIRVEDQSDPNIIYFNLPAKPLS